MRRINSIPAQLSALIFLPCALCLSLAACASKPPVQETVILKAQELSTRPLSADQLELSWHLVVMNTGKKPVLLDGLSCRASLEGADYLYLDDGLGIALAPGGSFSIPCSVMTAMPQPQNLTSDSAGWSPEQAAAPWALQAVLNLSEDGKTRAIACDALGQAPRIGKPSFRVLSIVIRQDDLINTKLLVELEVINPNLFPVSLSSFSYDLYGERRHWASGKLAQADLVPPLGSRIVGLELVMNFTQMNRAVLDQVIRLEQVNYRLTGAVTVTMGPIPPYSQDYDLSGASTVRR